MDRLKHLVSKRLQTMPAEAHPAADMLSAFAENALSGSERQQILAHLAACADCREIIYLAQSETAEAQTIRAFRPAWITSFAFRWGAVAASLVIIAGGLFLTREGFFRGQQKGTPLPENFLKVAEQKPPSEAGSVQAGTAAPAKGAMPVAKDENLPARRPEPKHMTAQLQSPLKFNSSDQVQMAATSSPPAAVNLDKRGVSHAQGGVTDSAAVAEMGNSTQPSTKGKDATAFSYAALNEVAGQPVGMGNLAGVIVDPSGSVVANAKITMKGPAGIKTVDSDQAGRFVFERLDKGSYSLKAVAPGFKPVEVGEIAVRENKNSELQLRLQIGSASGPVQVISASPQIEETKIANALIETEIVPRTEKTRIEVAAQDREQSAKLRAKKAQMNSALAAKAITVPQAQWSISPEGVLQRSLDSGENWQKVSIRNGSDFRAIFASDRDVWVGGKAGALFHSSDSGTTWAAVIAADDDEKLQSDVKRIEFTDSQNGTVTTVNGEKWVTSDAGQTWRKIAQ